MPFSKDTRLLQDASNEEHTSAKRVDLALGIAGAPVEPQTRCRLTGNSGVRRVFGRRVSATEILALKLLPQIALAWRWRVTAKNEEGCIFHHDLRGGALCALNSFNVRCCSSQGRSSVVEQRPFKPKVVGSIPTAPTNHPSDW